MNRFKRLFLIALAVLLLLGACSQPDIKVIPSPTIGEEKATEAYPYPQPLLPSGAGATPYPNPLPDQPTPDVEYVEPTPGGDTGVVIGRLVDLNTNEPLPFQTVYLGDIIPFVKGEGFSIGVKEMNSPHTIADKEGRFALGNVPPGTFVLVIWTPIKSYMITEPGSKDLMQVTVEAGKTLDVGTVKALDPMSAE